MQKQQSLITSDFLQRVTLIDPTNIKTVIKELKEKLMMDGIDFIGYKKLWKALYYAMWHSDKYQNQQLLAQEIAALVRTFYHLKKFQSLYLYIQAMFHVLTNEWDKIDYWRTNKFMLLYKNIQEEILKLCKHFNWKSSLMTWFNNIYIEKLVEQNQDGEGLCLHFIQIYTECLGKYSQEINYELLELLLAPFVDVNQQLKLFLQIAKGNPSKVLRDKVKENIFEKVSTLNLEAEVLQKFKNKILNLAQQKDCLQPQNRALLYDIYETLRELSPEDEDVEKVNGNHLNGNHVSQDVEQLIQKNNQLESNDVEVKPKKKKKVLQQVDQQEEEQIVAIESSNKNEKKEKKEKKLKAQGAAIIKKGYDQADKENEVVKADYCEIEGLDFSDVYNSKEKMQILKDIMATVPAYLFMSPSEKKKYFGNKESGSKCTHKRSVKFNLKNNQIKEFKSTEAALAVSKKQTNKKKIV